jgi:Tfp pilus assembly protein PilO
MKLSSTQKLIISILVVVVVVVAAILLLIVPQISRLSSLGAEIEQAEADYEAASLLLERRQAAKNRAAATESELLRLSNEVPAAPELPAFIIDLQNTANESGLDFVRIEPADPESPEGEVWTTVPIDMTLEGSWADYVDYLHRIRGLVRQVRIVSFEVYRFEEEVAEDECYDPPNRVQALMTVEVYTAPPDASASGTGTAPPPPE